MTEVFSTALSVAAVILLIVASVFLRDVVKMRSSRISQQFAAEFTKALVEAPDATRALFGHVVELPAGCDERIVCPLAFINRALRRAGCPPVGMALRDGLLVGFRAETRR